MPGSYPGRRDRTQKLWRPFRRRSELAGEIDGRASDQGRYSHLHREIAAAGLGRDRVELGLGIDGEVANTVYVAGAVDRRARLDRMMEIADDIGVPLADKSDLGQRCRVKLANADRMKRIEDERMRAAFDGVPNLAGKMRDEPSCGADQGETAIDNTPGSLGAARQAFGARNCSGAVPCPAAGACASVAASWRLRYVTRARAKPIVP